MGRNKILAMSLARSLLILLAEASFYTVSKLHDDRYHFFSYGKSRKFYYEMLQWKQ
jgi:hypothetical protein